MLEKYLNIIPTAFSGYANYLWESIKNPSWDNYFYYLILVSVVVYGFEITNPWRKNQATIRKDFWLDAFYMFFNFFIFSLIGYNALAEIGVAAASDIFGLFGIQNLVMIELGNLPQWSQFLILFLLADFLQWSIHYLLHHSKWLWRFHQVHHSVTEMGFAAHLRFHPMETIVYKSLLYIPLTVIGFNLHHLFALHAFTILIGHLNHANIKLDYGLLKYILNNPNMHMWHHAKELPNTHKNGVNFGITLSIWDYIFKTDYIPSSGKDIELGFDEVEKYPTSFTQQLLDPFKKK